MVSVIMPVFNSKRFLADAIGSVLAQTIRDWELIIVDDGSTDGSWEIANRFARKEPRIRVMQQRKSGVSVARNKGLEAATGDAVFFADSDDVVPPDALRVSWGTLRSRRADIVIGSYERIPARYKREDGRLQRKEEAQSVWAPPSEISGRRAVIEMLYGRISSAPWGRLFSKAVIDGLQFAASLSYAEDLEFNYQAFMNAKQIVVMGTNMYSYRAHPGSVSAQQYSSARSSPLNVIEAIRQSPEAIVSSELRQAATTSLFYHSIDIHRLLLHVDLSQRVEDVERALLRNVQTTSRSVVQDTEAPLNWRSLAVVALISPHLATRTLSAYKRGIQALAGLKDTVGLSGSSRRS